ncbi:MAG TPA: oxidoreductase [Pseudorhodoferax sp.]|nr:oxidoreductase [Pseudorhodoferax sp.]
MDTTATLPRVWLITGASRGFGLRIARAALARGDAVVATARRVDALAPLGSAPGLLPLALDVTDEAHARAVAEAATARFGRIDILVNNAGYGLLGAVEEASADEVRRLYETNVFGLLNVTRAVLPGMRARRAGQVLNFSSVGGLRAGPGFGVYCSTKFAVEGLSEALHAELAPLGVHVTVIEPGYFRTEFLESNSLAVSPNALDDYAATAGQVRAAARQISLNQPGDPERLAAAVLQLADAAQPPRRLPLGSDTLQVLDARGAELQEETRAWRAVSASTDFGAPALA